MHQTWTGDLFHKYVIHISILFSGNEILIPTSTWMNLENIMLSEISQTQKDKYCMVPLV